MASKLTNEWIDFLIDLNPLIPTCIALVGTWALTTSGALPACCMSISKHITSVFYALMAGTMLASASTGMLQEAIARAEQAQWSSHLPWIPVVIGMACGLLLLQSFTLIVALIHEHHKRKKQGNTASGVYLELGKGGGTLEDNDTDTADVQRSILAARAQTEQRLTSVATAAMETAMPRGKKESKKAVTLRRAIMMVSAIALQQLPEGLMLGISFANVARAPEDVRHRAMRVALSGCISVWLGSIPEGLAMMLPLRKARVHPIRGFAFVQVAMLMEVVAGLLGCALVSFVTSVLPFALGAVASAMIFTAVTEVVPAAYKGGSRTVSNIVIMSGFAMMIILINLFG